MRIEVSLVSESRGKKKKKGRGLMLSDRKSVV